MDWQFLKWFPTWSFPGGGFKPFKPLYDFYGVGLGRLKDSVCCRRFSGDNFDNLLWSGIDT